MRTTLFFAALFLVIWLTLCLNEHQRENHVEEALREILDRRKRDAMPQSGGM